MKRLDYVKVHLTRSESRSFRRIARRTGLSRQAAVQMAIYELLRLPESVQSNIASCYLEHLAALELRRSAQQAIKEEGRPLAPDQEIKISR